MKKRRILLKIRKNRAYTPIYEYVAPEGASSGKVFCVYEPPVKTPIYDPAPSLATASFGEQTLVYTLPQRKNGKEAPVHSTYAVQGRCFFVRADSPSSIHDFLLDLIKKNEIGLESIKFEDPAQAKGFLDYGIGHFTRNGDLIGRGYLYHAMGSTVKAFLDLRAAIRKRPGDIEALFGITVLRSELGMDARLENLQRALHQNPGSEDIARIMVRIPSKISRKGPSRQLLAKAVIGLTDMLDRSWEYLSMKDLDKMGGEYIKRLDVHQAEVPELHGRSMMPKTRYERMLEDDRQRSRMRIALGTRPVTSFPYRVT